MAVLGYHFDIKLLAILLGGGVNQPHQRGEVNYGGSGFAVTELAVKIPEVDTSGQRTAALALNVFADVVFAGFEQAVAVFAFDVQEIGFSHRVFQLNTQPAAAAAAAAAAASSSASSSALHEGAHTAWDFPSTLRVPINERARCLPHIKHDIVAAPNEVVAAKGEPDTLDL